MRNSNSKICQSHHFFIVEEDYWSRVTHFCPCDDAMKRTQQLIDKYNITTPQHFTMLYSKKGGLQLTDVFENFVEKSTLMYGNNPLYSYSAPDYTWKIGLKFTNTKLDYIKNCLLLMLENSIRGGVSTILGDSHVLSKVNKKPWTSTLTINMDRL